MKARTLLLITTAVACAAAACSPAAPTSPEPPAASPPAPSCPSGSPLAQDFDGDGLADLVVGSSSWNGTGRVQHQWIEPGDGGAGTWLVGGGRLSSADLNGDSCADAILFSGGHEPWLRSSPAHPMGSIRPPRRRSRSRRPPTWRTTNCGS